MKEDQIRRIENIRREQIDKHGPDGEILLVITFEDYGLIRTANYDLVGNMHRNIRRLHYRRRDHMVDISVFASTPGSPAL
jgi:hypothetical protein